MALSQSMSVCRTSTNSASEGSSLSSGVALVNMGPAGSRPGGQRSRERKKTKQLIKAALLLGFLEVAPSLEETCTDVGEHLAKVSYSFERALWPE